MAPNPNDWLVPIEWHGVDNDNKPATGRLVCTARALQIATSDPSDPVRVYTSPQTFDMVDGVATGALLASDYPGNSNQHFTWHFQELITNGSGTDYDLEVPISMQLQGMKLGSYAPTYPTAGLPVGTVSRAEFDALVRRVDDLQGISQGDGDITRMTFDDGVAGALLPAGGYVYSVTGKCRYSTSASKYGTGLGLALDGPAGDWGHFSVVSPNSTASDWQIYLLIKAAGTKQANFGEFQNELTGSTGMGTIGLKTGRSIALNPPEGTDGGSVASTAALPLNQWIRINVRVENDGTTSQYTVTCYWTDPESEIADLTITNSWPGPATDRISWGTGSAEASWNINVDTLSFKAGVDTAIPAYNPSVPLWLHEYEAANDRTVVAGDQGMEDATNAVGCQSLLTSMKHGTRGLKTTAGYVEYPIRTLAGQTGSVYLRRTTSGGAPSPVVSWMTGITQQAAIRFKTGGTGNVQIVGPAGSEAAVITNSLTTNIWGRIDYSHVWTSAASGTLVITARVNYLSAEAGDGTTYETITATFTGVPQPTSTRLGFSGAGWVGDIDSHRSNPNTTDLTSWNPVAPPLIQGVGYSLTGLTGATTAVVKAVVSGYATMNLGWSATADASGNLTGTIAFLGNRTPDAHGMVSWNITGLSPTVPRYFKLSPDGASSYVGDPMTVTARPADATAFSNWRITYVSCQSAVDGTPAVGGIVYEPTWADSLAWKAQELWFTGDGGYWGSKNVPTDTPWSISQRWTTWLASMPKQRAACANAPSRWLKDDHEVVPSNKDSNVDPGKTTVEKLHNNEAGMPYIFPFYPLTGALQTDSYGTYRRSLFGVENFTSRIRIIYLDAYCMERSAALMTDTPAAGYGSASTGVEKTWLGTEQDTLLENVLTTGTQPALTIFVCGKTFLGRQQGAVITNDWDKIWNYPSWRNWFGNLVDTHLPNAVWLGGDRHVNAYAPASMNPWADMPCWISSGTCMHNLGPTLGEVGTGTGATEGYTKLDPTNFKGGYQKTVMTYVRFTLSDDNAGTITLTGQSRYNQNDWNGTGSEEDQWSTWVAAGIKNGFTATDTFTY